MRVFQVPYLACGAQRITFWSWFSFFHLFVCSGAQGHLMDPQEACLFLCGVLIDFALGCVNVLFNLAIPWGFCGCVQSEPPRLMPLTHTEGCFLNDLLSITPQSPQVFSSAQCPLLLLIMSPCCHWKSPPEAPRASAPHRQGELL